MSPTRLLALVASVVLVLLAPGTALSAHAAEDTYEAYGQVYDPRTGDSIRGALVEFFLTDPEADASAVATHTATLAGDEVNGLFAVDVDAGTYWVRASDPAGAYHPITTGPWVVDATDQQVGLFALEAVTATLSGSVTGPDGEPLDCGGATLFAAGDPDVELDYSDVGNGRFEFLAPLGAYKVRIEACDGGLASRWVGGSDFPSASRIVLDADGADVGTTQLTENRVVGTVRSASGTALKGIRVSAYSVSPFNPQDQPDGALVTATTDASGHYTLRGLTPSEFKVQFEDKLAQYATEWHDDAATYADAELVAVPEGGSVTVDASLALAPASTEPVAIKGSVKDKAGAPVAGADVSVLDANGIVGGTRTLRDGTYTFPGSTVGAGTYRILVEDNLPQDESDLGDRFIEQYYPTGNSYDRAAPVVVSGTAATVLPAMTVRTYGTVAGSVVAPGIVDPAEGLLYATAYDEDGDRVTGRSVAADGTYRLDGLRPGVVKVQVEELRRDGEGPARVIPQWYLGKTSFATATGIVVPDGATGSATASRVTLTDKLTAVTAPTTSGTAQRGKKMTAARGTWNRVVAIDFAYRWQRYNPTTRKWADIPRATASSYTATASDVGKKVRVRVLAVDQYDRFRDGEAFSTARTVAR